MAALNPDEIEIVREIIGVFSLSEISAKAAALTEAQNTRTRDDIVQWEKFNNKFSHLKSSGEFGLEKDPEAALVRIANRVRIRFGYQTISNLTDLQATTSGYSVYTAAAVGRCCPRHLGAADKCGCVDDLNP